MNNREIVNVLMFEFESLDNKEILEYISQLPFKVIRWLGANHPDNRVRKVFFRYTNIEIGAGTVINQNMIISDDYKPLLIIGKRVAIAPNVTIICSSGPNNSLLQGNPYVQENLIVNNPVHIYDDVWIGANAVILPGVSIGSGSIIGASSLVNKDVPSGVIIAGNPAIIIKKIPDEE